MHFRLFLIIHSFISTCYGNFGHDIASVSELGAEPDTDVAEALMMLSGNIGENVLPQAYAPLNTEENLVLFSKKEQSPEKLTTAKEQLSPDLLARYLPKGTGGSEYFTSTDPQRELISLGISVPILEERLHLNKFLRFVASGNGKLEIPKLREFLRRARESTVDWQLLLILENQAKFKFEGMLKALSDWNPQWTKEQSLERLNDIKLHIERHTDTRADAFTSSAIENTVKWENGGYIKFLEPLKALSTDSKFSDPNIVLFLRRTARILDKDGLVKIQELSKGLDDISSFARASGSRFLTNTRSVRQRSIKKTDDQRILKVYQKYVQDSNWLLLTQHSKDSLDQAVEARLKELQILNDHGQIIG